jgi:WD40 repeat protein
MSSNEEYDISIDVDGEIFPYTSCITQDIFLKKHFELPQDLTYESPQQSQDEKYIGIIGKGKDSDTLFIWSKNNLNNPQYTYRGKKINCFEFAGNGRSFVIVYEKNSPVHCNLNNGKKICKFERSDMIGHKSLGCAFTCKSHYFALVTEEGLVVWDVLNGKIEKIVRDKSPSKFLRKNVLISISEEGELKVTDISNDKVIKQFKLLDVDRNTDILSCMLNENKNYFYYATKKGFFYADINKKEVKFLQEFDQKDTQQVIISNDCINAISTNMKDIHFWKLDEGKIGTFFKENFTSINVNFLTNKIMTSNNICINIWDYSVENETEQYIWLNNNPNKFDRFYFSPDFAVLLVIVDDNNAVLYNTISGQVIKKWSCDEPEWSIACVMAPETSLTAVMATKMDKDRIRVWNYNNGSELMTLTGFNAHSLSFSTGGNLLAAGCKEGDEIGRVWDLITGNYNSLMNEHNDNKNTSVYLTKEEPMKVILVAEKQKPLVYDVESGNRLFECSSSCAFEKIDEINSSMNNLFYVKGLSTDNENIAVLFNLDNGEVIKIFNNCINIDISKDGKYLLAKSDNDNGGKLTIYDIEDPRHISNVACEIDPDVSNFLQGGKAIVSGYGTINKITYLLTHPQNGKAMGQLTCTKKKNEYTELDLSANPEENSLVLRYIKLSD